MWLMEKSYFFPICDLWKGCALFFKSLLFCLVALNPIPANSDENPWTRSGILKARSPISWYSPNLPFKTAAFLLTQSDFCPAYSTEMALTKVIDDFFTAKSKGPYFVLMFLDTIDRSLLLKSIHNLSFHNSVHLVLLLPIWLCLQYHY